MRIFTRPNTVDADLVAIPGEIADAQEFFDQLPEETAVEVAADPRRPRSGRGLAALLAATTFVTSTFVLADRLSEAEDSALLVGPGPGAAELAVPYPGLIISDSTHLPGTP